MASTTSNHSQPLPDVCFPSSAAVQRVLRKAYSTAFAAFLALVSLGSTISTAEQPESNRTQEVGAKLSRESAQLASQSYQEAVAASTFQLVQQESKRNAVELSAGVTYAIVAACEDGCTQVQIELLDPQGGLLIQSPEVQAVVIVNGTPAAAGAYTVILSAPGCRDKACYAGFAMLRKEPVVLRTVAAAIPPTEERLVWAIQETLERRGCQPGKIDGDWGPDTKAALRRLAKATGLQVDSDAPSAELLAKISDQSLATCSLSRTAVGEGQATNISGLDGVWIIHWRGTGEKPCKYPNGSYSGSSSIRISKGTIGPGPATGSVRPSITARGRITPAGRARWLVNALTDGALVRFTGSFGNGKGSGGFVRVDGRCTAVFTARQDNN